MAGGRLPNDPVRLVMGEDRAGHVEMTEAAGPCLVRDARKTVRGYRGIMVDRGVS